MPLHNIPDPETENVLLNYTWPDSVRELENPVERAARNRWQQHPVKIHEFQTPGGSREENHHGQHRSDQF